MKIKKTAAIIFSCAILLFARSLLDSEILDVALGENILVAASKSGVSWKALTGENTDWQSIECNPLWAQLGANVDNIVVGSNNAFAVRLDVASDNSTISFLREDGRIIPQKVEDDSPYGLEGIFREEDNKFFFTVGDSSFAVLSNNSLTIERRNAFDWFNKPILLDSVGNPTELLSTPGQNEEIIKFLGDLVLTETFRDDNGRLVHVIGQDRLFVKNNNGDFVHRYTGDTQKAATTPDGFIYRLDKDGNLRVLSKDRKLTTEAQERQRIMLKRLDGVNVPPDFALTDISVFVRDNNSYSIAFASTRGIFYSDDEETALRNETPFEHFYKAVPIRSGLKEIYAEPGILSANNRNTYATFRYALAEADRVSIDIFNYNLDFVVNIIENQSRPKASDGTHSTNVHFDRWDGTVNNNGGRQVSPGVYFFRITTQKGKQQAFGRIVIAR